MPETDEDVTPDEVTGVDADESEANLSVVIDKNLIHEAGEESPREPKEDDDGGS